MNTNLELRVIIIGAGAAGIATASRLLEGGIEDIIVLEAEDRIGGRICSKNFHGKVVDLGAQWCHGEEDNVVYQLVRELDLLDSSTNSYNDYTFYNIDGTKLDKQLTDKLINIAYRIRSDEKVMREFEGSFGDYFKQRYKEDVSSLNESKDFLNHADCLLEWFHKMCICLDGAQSWFEVSCGGLTDYKDCEGNLYLHWKNNGYKSILHVLMNKVSNSQSDEKLLVENKILLNKNVSQVMWHENKQNPEKVTVNCSDGSQYSANHVIITASLGVLKKSHKNLFVPPLPEIKQAAIEGLGFGVVNKIMLKFPSQWWPNTCTGFSFLWSESDVKTISLFSIDVGYDMSWIKDVFGYYPIDNGPILLAFIVGSHAHNFESIPKNVILKGCTFVLRKFIDTAFDKITDPIDVLYSTWSSNIHFCGSYSYHSIKSDQLNVSSKDLAAPVLFNQKLRLLFAGEATHPYYYSTVHGAIESGFREANRIIKFYNL